jgi:hypothetical protein
MSGRRSNGSPSQTRQGAPGGRSRRLLVFVVVVVLLVGGLGAYLLVQRHLADARAAEEAAVDARRPRLDVDDVLAVPHLVVRNTEPGPSYGKIALVPLSDPDGPRAIVDVECDRVAAVPTGAFCLQQVPGLVTTYRAVFLDERFHQTGTQPLDGPPSRARMSADGRYASSTVFVEGHSYADAAFTTATVITDLSTQTPLGNLETWTTTKDGEVVAAQDRNYWGVTFVGNGPTFYATLGTDGHRYLVSGDITTRTMTVLGPEGACPSIAPDGQTVVFKQADPQSRADHFVAMSLASGAVVRLPEGRSVDDQVNWQDEDTVVYGVARGTTGSTDFDVWSAPAAGTGTAQLLVPHASSPSVVSP